MTNQHPITPSPELVQQWVNQFVGNQECMPEQVYIARAAAQWGADQELLAAENYLKHCAAWEEEDITEFYNYRRPRPKPPSLAEEALEALQHTEEGWRPVPADCDIIRRALERLKELEGGK